MEQINAKLFKLLKDELYDLNIGHGFNRERIKAMKELCNLLIFNRFAVLSDTDIIKMLRFYD